MGLCTSVTASRMTDAYGASTHEGVQPDPEGAEPRRDHRLLARWSRHVVPMTPGNGCSFLKKVDSVSVTLLLILLNVDF